MKKHHFLWMIPFGLFFLMTSPAFGKKIALHGLPVIQTRSSSEVSHNVRLDNNQKLTNAIIIMIEDGKYYWETRDHRELTFKSMKDFDLFIDLETGGYIKVFTKNGQTRYMEHISIKRMKAFTYWGNIITYNPKVSE
ncbi:MAG: hypothetical protein ACE5FZ_03195 [Nitrospiria bacterium]